MKYADIILPLALPRNYTYSIPEEWEDRVCEGLRVAVPLKKKKYAGIVRKIHSEAPSGYQARPILDILDAERLVGPQQLRFWEWMAGYYLCTEGEVLQAALPAHLKLSSETILLVNPVFGDDFSSLDADEFLVLEALEIRKELNLEEVQDLLGKRNVYPVVKSLLEKNACLVYEELQSAFRPKWETTVEQVGSILEGPGLEEVFHELEKAPKQLTLLMAFIHLQQTQGLVRQAELLKKSGASAANLKALLDRQILSLKKREVDRIDLGPPAPLSLDFTLNAGQEQALSSIHDQFADHQVILLFGVTSSGKTMIYVKLIESLLESGAQVLYLLPEIALTTQLISRLQKFFGNRIGVYHSRFNNNERVELWNRVGSGEIRIILGARSALFLPFQNLGLIILDEEHDGSFKQQDPAPRYHARDAAILYASQLKAKVLLGSATPSLESFYNAHSGKYGLVELRERHGQMAMPEMQLVDIRKELFQKKTAPYLSETLKQAMTRTLEDGKQVILFQNRRGFAPYQICLSCGWVPQCRQCDVALTYHKYRNQLQCHYCGTYYPLVELCAACGSSRLEWKSFGTEKIEDDLAELFPRAHIGRMDLDTARSREGHQKLIRLFEQKRIDILVGTQMVVKGLDFEQVSLVGILRVDNLLHFPDFRVNERAFQLMEQVSGRAGRKEVRGKVILQALNLTHPILSHVLAHDYEGMYREELEHRREFQYPPFTRLIHLTLRHRQAELAEQGARELAGILRPALGPRISGPGTPPVSRVRNAYLRELLIRLPRDTRNLASVKQFIQASCRGLQSGEPFKSLDIVVDIDPY